MLVTVYEAEWFRAAQEGVRAAIDPTRMAQGIMTGIGFLGAGVIMKEGLSVRGLTTAASIWTTAAIGILVGIGLYMPAVLTTALTLGALGGFRWLERHIKTESSAHFVVRFAAARAPAQHELVALATGLGFRVREVSHVYERSAAVMEYSVRMLTFDPAASYGCRIRYARVKTSCSSRSRRPATDARGREHIRQTPAAVRRGRAPLKRRQRLSRQRSACSSRCSP